jgi:hypothetical protein
LRHRNRPKTRGKSSRNLCRTQWSRDHERSKQPTRFLFVKAEIIIEQTEKLLFHDIYLLRVEVDRVGRPVFVFWRGVVEIFSRYDERGEEEAVAGAWKRSCGSVFE